MTHLLKWAAAFLAMLLSAGDLSAGDRHSAPRHPGSSHRSHSTPYNRPHSITPQRVVPRAPRPAFSWERRSYRAPPSVHRHHDYYRPGYRLPRLPYGSHRLHVHGLEYFFFDGFFYRPHLNGYFIVDAPIGAVVLSLPSLYATFYLNGIEYYRAGHTYYRRHHPRGYIVVPDPGYWR